MRRFRTTLKVNTGIFFLLKQCSQHGRATPFAFQPSLVQALFAELNT